jgi:phage-related tail protein
MAISNTMTTMANQSRFIDAARDQFTRLSNPESKAEGSLVPDGETRRSGHTYSHFSH